MSDLVIRNVRPLGKAATDIAVTKGRISAIGTNLPATNGASEEDGGGALLLPGLIEAHTHLDKTLLGMAS